MVCLCYSCSVSFFLFETVSVVIVRCNCMYENRHTTIKIFISGTLCKRAAFTKWLCTYYELCNWKSKSRSPEIVIDVNNTFNTVKEWFDIFTTTIYSGSWLIVRTVNCSVTSIEYSYYYYREMKRAWIVSLTFRIFHAYCRM